MEQFGRLLCPASSKSRARRKRQSKDAQRSGTPAELENLGAAERSLGSPLRGSSRRTFCDVKGAAGATSKSSNTDSFSDRPQRPRMSALGQMRTCAVHEPMSALPPIVNVCGAIADVCYGPKAEFRGLLIWWEQQRFTIHCRRCLHPT